MLLVLLRHSRMLLLWLGHSHLLRLLLLWLGHSHLLRLLLLLLRLMMGSTCLRGLLDLAHLGLRRRDCRVALLRLGHGLVAWISGIRLLLLLLMLLLLLL